jgi:hypothetical protein
MPNTQSEFGLATEYSLQCCIASGNGSSRCCWLSRCQGGSTLPGAPVLIAQLDKFRKKRNIGSYERAGAISEQEAKEMFALAKNLRDEVEKWLRSNHPELL